jgi:putative nucleotidyltransferase with HDIG domain
MRSSHRSERRSGLRIRPLDCSHASVLDHIRELLRPRRAQGYLVGGLLRDLLLGRTSNDIDIVVRGVRPEVLAAHLHQHFGFSTPAVFTRFKTALTVKGDLEVEICTLQGSLPEDAAKRDFTVNCLYADITGLGRRLRWSQILDPTGLGIPDLRSMTLRTASEPWVTLWLDPLRILRAVRFHAAFGFKLQRELLGSIPRVVYLLGRIPAERVRMELEQIVTSRRVASSFRLMHKLGILSVVSPELSRTAGFLQATPYHAYDLFTHTIKTAANTPSHLMLRLAALLHDLGKVDTRTFKKGRAVYYGHEEASAELAESVLRRLRFPRRLTADVRFLVRNHMINYSRNWSDRAVRRLVKKMGKHLNDVIVLAEADRRAQGPELGLPKNIDDLRRRIRSLEKAGIVHPRLPVTGNDIMAILTLSQGPMVGQAKDFLLEQASKMRRPITRPECIELLRNWHKKVGRQNR